MESIRMLHSPLNIHFRKPYRGKNSLPEVGFEPTLSKENQILRLAP